MKSVGNRIGNVDIFEERRVNRLLRGFSFLPPYRPIRPNNVGTAPVPNVASPTSVSQPPGLLKKTVSAMTNTNKRSIKVPRDSQPVLCPCPEPPMCKYLWRCDTYWKRMTPEE